MCYAQCRYCILTRNDWLLTQTYVYDSKVSQVKNLLFTNITQDTRMYYVCTCYTFTTLHFNFMAILQAVKGSQYDHLIKYYGEHAGKQLLMYTWIYTQTNIRIHWELCFHPDECRSNIMFCSPPTPEKFVCLLAAECSSMFTR